MDKILELINEGIYDKGIFKAVFLAGGPGSGKSFIINQLFGIPEHGLSFSYTGLKLCAADTEFVYLLKKHGLPTDLLSMSKSIRDMILDPHDSNSIFSQSRKLYDQRVNNYINGHLGLIFDGTGKDAQKVINKKNNLESIGYDCYSIFVNTDLDIAIARNTARPRKLPNEIVIQLWNDAQNNKKHFQEIFKSNFIEIENNTSDMSKLKQIVTPIQSRINKIISAPITNKIALEIINFERNRDK